MTNRLVTVLTAGLVLGFDRTFAQQGPYDPGLPIPHISNNHLASPELVDFLYDYYTAKSEHNICRYMDFFHPTEASYTDVSLGTQFRNVSAIREGFTGVFARMKPGSIAYPLQIVGDLDSAIVASVDTPGMFGVEVRLLTVLDFDDGKLTRVLDLWDGRKSPILKGRGKDKYFDNLGLDNLHNSPDPAMAKALGNLNDLFSKGDSAGVQALFSYDAVLVDMTARTRVQGQLAIGRYLARSIDLLPYGAGTALRHVVGKGRGGGYEWMSKQGQGIYGLSMVELDKNGLITRYAALWDGSREGDHQLYALQAAALEDEPGVINATKQIRV